MSNSNFDWYVSVSSLKDTLDELAIDYAMYDDALQAICDLSDRINAMLE